MEQDIFANRHIGVSQSDLNEMLNVIGVDSVDELISQVIPENIQLKEPLNMAQEGMTEVEFASHIREIAAKNAPFRTFIGMGYYGTAAPAAITRNIFENPAWYTSYTPYQAEISQGRLEALLNFQTMVISMTGMEISNCSLLDEGTAAAEAMNMMLNQRSRAAQKANKRTLFIDENIFSQTLDVLLTRSEPLNIDIVIDDFASYEFTGSEFGAIVQYPGANGTVNDFEEFTAKAHQNDMLVTAVVDIMALALLKAPGEWGADIVVGSTQRFGIPMFFGGPAAAYLATKDAYKRTMPGRIIGVSVDRLGNKALRMALQTREQHIKRDKATSNICTSQALLATMAGMYAVYHGPKGIKQIALNIHYKTQTVANALTKMGYKLITKSYFDTLEVVDADTEEIRKVAEFYKVNLYFPNSTSVRFSLDELTTIDDVNTLIAIFAEAEGVKAKQVKEISEKSAIPASLERKSEILTEKVFSRYHSETELMRYIKKLELREISLATSMISLGSCTMKLNSAASMMPLSLAEFQNIHPFIPLGQAEGYVELMKRLEKQLAIITGFAAVSNQPNSGAAGEYSGLMVIRAYHQANGSGARNVALIPASAHGTNPASAAMAGMKVVVVACDELGNIDVEDFKAKAEEHKNDLSCAMITYPSTHGIFEVQIKELCDIVHSNGGQVYMDGANMNAQVGITSPGYIGADVCHLNLHKTFAIPHGGGGPGVGTIGVAKHLVKFLPSHAVVRGVGGEEGITAVASSPWGSAGVLAITYAYISMLGAKGLRKATEMAILNANYTANALKGEFGVLYTGATGRVGHEMIIDCRNFKRDYGVECADIARRLMDFGFHAPTLSFPVHETLMVEPTESESKGEIDRFIDSLIQIKRECEAIAKGDMPADDNLLKNAPHTCVEIAGDEWSHPYTRKQAAFPLEWVAEKKFWPYVSKIDGGYGDRNLVCSCGSLESYL
ncbi:MAG: aminomethyl-transferring glycine dehydrogenase [Rikenellaceae bacterium]